MMKALKTSAANFGPFASISIGADRYICDATEFPFSVVGDDAEIVDADTIDLPAPPAPEPPTPPGEVSRRRGLQALFLNGVTEEMIEAQLAMLPSPQKELAQIEFRTSQVFERNRPLVQQIGVAMGLNVDALFIQAAALP